MFLFFDIVIALNKILTRIHLITHIITFYHHKPTSPQLTSPNITTPITNVVIPSQKSPSYHFTTQHHHIISPQTTLHPNNPPLHTPTTHLTKRTTSSTESQQSISPHAPPPPKHQKPHYTLKTQFATPLIPTYYSNNPPHPNNQPHYTTPSHKQIGHAHHWRARERWWKDVWFCGKTTLF